jgi:hypothetical protein
VAQVAGPSAGLGLVWACQPGRGCCLMGCWRLGGEGEQVAERAQEVLGELGGWPSAHSVFFGGGAAGIQVVLLAVGEGGGMEAANVLRA